MAHGRVAPPCKWAGGGPGRKPARPRRSPQPTQPGTKWPAGQRLAQFTGGPQPARCAQVKRSVAGWLAAALLVGLKRGRRGHAGGYPRARTPCQWMAASYPRGRRRAVALSGQDFRASATAAPASRATVQLFSRVLRRLGARQEASHRDGSRREGEGCGCLALPEDKPSCVAPADLVRQVRDWFTVDFQHAVDEIDNPILGEAGAGVEMLLASTIVLKGRIADLDDEHGLVGASLR